MHVCYLVLWMWLVLCLCGVPCRPALVCGASSRLGALSAPFKSHGRGAFPYRMLRFPGLARRLRGARGSRPKRVLMVPSTDPPRRGRRAPSALYPCRASLGGSLWRVPAALVSGFVRYSGLAFVDPVTQACGCCTVCLATGLAADASGLFSVDAVTSPYRSEDATPGSRAYVCARVS